MGLTLIVPIHDKFHFGSMMQRGEDLAGETILKIGVDVYTLPAMS